MTTASKIAMDILDATDLSIDDLRRLNEVLNEKARMIQRKVALKLGVGTKVEFTSRRGFIVKGVITKIMQKNVKVFCQETGVTWSVTPSLLREVK